MLPCLKSEVFPVRNVERALVAHATDKSGYPLDPELRRLEFYLGELAGLWRGAYGDQERQDETVQEYRAILARLYELGWDATLDIESELPEELMPEEYLRRNSRFHS
jgi:hypothetical protein